MPNHSSTARLRHLSTLFSSGTVSGLSDAQLLERITAATRATSTAEAAFEALLARHGPMVLGVCRRALSDPRDVEDAFQATFLVLVRKSGAVRVDDSLGRWLYGVARRVAHRARTLAERRRVRETSAATWEPATPAPDAERAELIAALDDELGRLPEKYRVPVLLCDFEGLTHTEAASRLQWPVGTVKGRLAQARCLLRGRLTRRGLAPTALLLGTVIKAEARLVVPADLARKTVRSALQFTMGGQAAAALASASVVALSRGAMRAMLLTKLKMGAVGLLAAFGITAGTGVLAQAARNDGAGTSYLGSGLAGNSGGDDRPANAVAIVSDVESDTKIVSLAPNGLKVRRGDVVCRLDSSDLKDRLAEQVIKTAGAEAAYAKAELTRKIAEMALTEYEKGVFKQELQAVTGEISLADAERKRAEERLVWSNKMRARGYVSRDQNLADKIALERTVFSQEQAEDKKRVLEKFTYAKTVKQLKGEIESARSAEEQAKRLLKLEKSKQARIKNQIGHCRILAPISGTVEYARWPVPGVEGQSATVEKGMTVRWGQLLLWILPIGERVDDDRPAWRVKRETGPRHGLGTNPRRGGHGRLPR